MADALTRRYLEPAPRPQNAASGGGDLGRRSVQRHHAPLLGLPCLWALLIAVAAAGAVGAASAWAAAGSSAKVERFLVTKSDLPAGYTLEERKRFSSRGCPDRISPVAVRKQLTKLGFRGCAIAMFVKEVDVGNGVSYLHYPESVAVLMRDKAAASAALRVLRRMLLAMLPTELGIAVHSLPVSKLGDAAPRGLTFVLGETQEPASHAAGVYRVKSHPIIAGIVGVLLLPYAVYGFIDVVRADALGLAAFVVIVAVPALTFIARAGLAAVVTTEAARLIQEWTQAARHGMPYGRSQHELGELGDLGGQPIDATLRKGIDGVPMLELSVRGVPATPASAYLSEIREDAMTLVRQLEHRVGDLPALAERVEAAGVKAADEAARAQDALAQPFKHADALAAATARSSAIATRCGDRQQPDSTAASPDSNVGAVLPAGAGKLARVTRCSSASSASTTGGAWSRPRARHRHGCSVHAATTT